MTRLRLRLLAPALLLALASRASAENPRINLKLDGLTATEAVGRLSREAGIPMSLDLPRFPAGAQIPALYQRLNDRSNFDWSMVSFAEALRQLCQKYSLQPVRRWGAYSLHPVSGAGGPAKKIRDNQIQKDGITFYVRKITSRDNRTRDLTGARTTQPEQTLWVDLAMDLGEKDVDQIAGLDNIVARDDRGQVLVTDRPPGRLPSISTPADSPYPDEWLGSVYLSLPHPLAERLAWIEADVIGFEAVKPHRLELPVPAAPDAAKATAAGISVELLEYRPGSMDGTTGARVRVRVYIPASAGAAALSGDAMPYPSIVGESGRLYPPSRPSAQGGASGAGINYVLDCEYGAIQEPIKKIAFRIMERGQPKRLMRVRLEGVPLPDYRPFLPRRTNVPLPTPANQRPLYDAGGAALAFPVYIEKDAVTEGYLTLGLTPRSGPNEGAVYWLDAELSAAGEVRVTDIKPGQYRVLRVFYPRIDRQLPNKGRWLNAEVDAQLVAGKEARLATLRWTPETAASSAPALGGGSATPPTPPVKPAPKKPAPKKKPARGKKPA